ncbi:MAG: VWA domain-containing protein [Candidatus Aenigmarchaeota archaeon]|nr:VWA domain-containing protein [Candidatus Aenigmarchaeota archaeon]
MVLAHYLSLRFTRRKALKFANFPAIESITGKKILSKNYTLLILRLATLCLLIFSVAGTTLWYEGQTSEFDFMLAIDSSGSMMATDYTPNRLDAAKGAALLFVDNLPERSNVGIVSFAGVSFIKQKPTSDLGKIVGAIENISIEPVGGTAIGSAIITSSNLLSESEQAKVLILLTDGQNNVGPSIETAIEYANENYITVNTIGIGTEEGGGFPNLTFVSKLDPNTLKLISNSTGGKYYGARNETALSEAYKEIALSSIQKLSTNLSLLFLFLAIILLFLEWGLANTKYRTLP